MKGVYDVIIYPHDVWGTSHIYSEPRSAGNVLMNGISSLRIIQSYWGVECQLRSLDFPLPQIRRVGDHWMPRLHHSTPRQSQYGSVPDTRYLSPIVSGCGWGRRWLCRLSGGYITGLPVARFCCGCSIWPPAPCWISILWLTVINPPMMPSFRILDTLGCRSSAGDEWIW